MNSTITVFERRFSAVLLAADGIVLAALALLGPLFMGRLQYATSLSGEFQLMGQDAANLFVFFPLFIVGGLLLWLGKKAGDYILALGPIFLLYYGLSVGIGIEWSRPEYSGNSEQAFGLFLTLIISGVLFIPVVMGLFSRRTMKRFSRRTRIVYVSAFLLFIMLFAGMWISEVRSVLTSGTSRGYDEAPTVFWVIRYLDLGISIPLALLSIYMLLTRPSGSVGIQLLLYGFFITMIVSVNAMGLVMALKSDADFLFSQQLVFVVLALIIFIGYGLILRNIRGQKE